MGLVVELRSTWTGEGARPYTGWDRAESRSHTLGMTRRNKLL
jgi:hypothetical protein